MAVYTTFVSPLGDTFVIIRTKKPSGLAAPFNTVFSVAQTLPDFEHGGCWTRYFVQPLLICVIFFDYSAFITEATAWVIEINFE